MAIPTGGLSLAALPAVLGAAGSGASLGSSLGSSLGTLFGGSSSNSNSLSNALSIMQGLGGFGKAQSVNSSTGSSGNADISSIVAALLGSGRTLGG